MLWDELKGKVYLHPRIPDAIPYRTSYYRRDWGFCATKTQYDELERLGGPFEVAIESELAPGNLTYGECLLPGRSKREILISCYICHPSMANDSLSGVVVSALLARHLANMPERHWSYRIAFVPETLGAILYCARNEEAMKAIDMGLVVTTVGGPGKFGYKQSFDASHPLNGIVEEVLRRTGQTFITYPFDIHGSDERQYSSQGFRINCVTVCRDRYYEYPQYHSSLDDLNFVTADQLSESFQVYVELIDRLEARRVYRNRVPAGEVMLSRHGLYPSAGGDQLPQAGGRSKLDLTLWLLFLCDGQLAIEDIALKLGTPKEQLQGVADELVAKGVLEEL
jgi:aminopeptidase-like protein